MAEQTESCLDCKFFLRAGAYPGGICRRFPPVFSGQSTDHPYVNTEDWCGEFIKSAFLSPTAAPEKQTCMIWVNVYPTYLHACVSKDEAKNIACLGSLAIAVPVTFEFEVGYGK